MTERPRRRPSQREPTSPRTIDETTPMTANAQSATKDYASIPTQNPAPTPQQDVATTSGAKPGAQEDATQRRTTSAEREAAAVEQRDSSRWRAFWEKYGSVELENKGSVARDHLALERTFLAWLRTSLSFASIGIAITQLFRLNTSLSNPQKHQSPPSHPSQRAIDTTALSPQAKLRHLGKPLGATFIGISIVMLCIGFHRYFEAQHYVIRGKFPASRGSIVIVSVIAGALIVSSLVVILVTAPTAFEN